MILVVNEDFIETEGKIAIFKIIQLKTPIIIENAKKQLLVTALERFPSTPVFLLSQGWLYSPVSEFAASTGLDCEDPCWRR